jgi:Transglutaminase-like superfamily
MKRLVLESWSLLLLLDLVTHFRNFNGLHNVIRTRPVHPRSDARSYTTKELCDAVDLACVFYFKRVLCLQRSGATTLLLRRYGWNAEMVIGAQILPFKSHAWVEVQGTIVNDKPHILEIYSVLERC